VVAQPLPDGGLRLIIEDRTEQLQLASARDTLLRVRAATFDNLFEAISVFASDGRLYVGNRRFIEQWDLDATWLSEHPRVDELRPLLTSIGGLAEMLAGAYAGKLTPTAADYVNPILESVERLSKLINDVLDLTTGDARGVALERERVDLAGLCRAAAETARARAAEKAQKLDAEISPAAGFVFGDARRLRESVEH